MNSPAVEMRESMFLRLENRTKNTCLTCGLSDSSQLWLTRAPWGDQRLAPSRLKHRCQYLVVRQKVRECSPLLWKSNVYLILALFWIISLNLIALDVLPSTSWAFSEVALYAMGEASEYSKDHFKYLSSRQRTLDRLLQINLYKPCINTEALLS